MTEPTAVTTQLTAIAGAMAPHLAEGAGEPGTAEIDGWRAGVDGLARALRANAEACFADLWDTRRLRTGIAAAQAAQELEIATRALTDAAAPRADARVGGLLLHMGYQLCLTALKPLAWLIEPAWRQGPSLEIHGEGGREGDAVPATPAADVDFSVLATIARYHREHERHYAMVKMDLGGELVRLANRLRVVADIWLQGGAPAAAEVDYTDPRYRAAGCDDLNALPALPLIGILFMEGEGEPREIIQIKAKLRAVEDEYLAAGLWLADKMDAAWQRESMLFTEALTAIAWPRLQAVATNWRGANDMALTGRLAGLAAQGLNEMDFTPEAIRAARDASGRRLRAAAWIASLAGQAAARTGGDLVDNEFFWTEYSEFMAERAGD